MTPKITYFTADNSDPLTFNESLEARNKVEAGAERCGLLEGDMPPNARLIAGHGHVYITGSVHRGGHICGRQNMFSAKRLDPSVKIEGGYLMVVGDEADKEGLAHITRGREAPPILVVPENSRAAVFDSLAHDNIRSDSEVTQTGIPTPSLRTLRKKFPTMPMTLYFSGEEIPMPSPRNTGRSSLRSR